MGIEPTPPLSRLILTYGTACRQRWGYPEKTMNRTSKLALLTLLSLATAATWGQQNAPTAPTAPAPATQTPTPSTSQPPGKNGTSASKAGLALFVTGAIVVGVGAWWDRRTEQIEEELRKARRKVLPPDSNGDVTIVERDRNERVIEKQKVDKHGVEKAFDSYTYEGEVCVYEQHMERITHGPNRGGHKHRVVRRHKDGSLKSDETDEYDEGGSQVGGTRTVVGEDGQATTQTYDRDTNSWK